jgi:uncharacterized membrane protein YfcA
MDFVDILIAVIIMIAFFGEAIFGFGGGVISVPLISLLIGVKDAATLVLVFQFCMGVLLLKSYEHIDWKTAKPLTVGAIAGTIVGTLLLSAFNAVFLELFLAGAILLFLAKSLWFSGFSRHEKDNTIIGIGAGSLGGLLQGLIGTGGPVFTMYLSVTTPKKLELRSTLIFMFFITSLVRLSISGPEHLFTSRVLHLILLTMPLFLIAIYLGHHVHKKVSDVYYKRAIKVILAGSAIILLYKVFL